jgi:hypothetical protein
MQSQNVDSIRTLFQSRLATLEHLLKSAQTHFCDGESLLQKRIAADMFPLTGGQKSLEDRQGKLYSALTFLVMLAPTTVNLQKFIHTFLAQLL